MLADGVQVFENSSGRKICKGCVRHSITPVNNVFGINAGSC